MSKYQNALEVLKRHQEWRLGGDGKPTDPKQLTLAVDTAVTALKIAERLGQKPSPFVEYVGVVERGAQDSFSLTVKNTAYIFQRMATALIQEVEEQNA
jgi:hypothetical protein